MQRDRTCRTPFPRLTAFINLSNSNLVISTPDKRLTALINSSIKHDLFIARRRHWTYKLLDLEVDKVETSPDGRQAVLEATLQVCEPVPQP